MGRRWVFKNEIEDKKREDRKKRETVRERERKREREGDAKNFDVTLLIETLSLIMAF